MGDDAVVFTTGYFQDGEGRSFTPREAARIMATGATPTTERYSPLDEHRRTEAEEYPTVH